MSDLIYTDLKISRDTAGVVEDLLTLDSVGGDDGNGSALRFINGSATKDLALTLGRISASRAGGAVRLDLAIVRDPAFSTGDETSALLSLVSDTNGLQHVAIAAGSTLAVMGDTVLNGTQINGSLVVTGTVNGRKLAADGTQLDQHLSRADNPHATTAAQVGALAATGGSIAGNLKVAGATTLGDVSVSGGATLSGHATVRGNLGIGTPAPINRLHVFNTGPGLTIDGDQFPGFRIALNGDTVAMAQVRTDESAALDFGTYRPSPLYFLTNNVRRMSIGPNGNIGIGNQTPMAMLHVAGHMAVGPFSSGMAGGGIEVTGPASELTFMRRSLAAWPATPAPDDRFSWYSPDATARLWTDRIGDLMTIDANGNLALRGTVRSASSRQLKENIVPLAGALAKVARLQGVSFTWKSDRDRAREIGLIAEDAGAVVPELVDTGNPGFLSYDRIAVLAVQAIKELSRQVAELSGKVATLEGRI